jgi:hypothetical protein
VLRRLLEEVGRLLEHVLVALLGRLVVAAERVEALGGRLALTTLGSRLFLYRGSGGIRGR